PSAPESLDRYSTLTQSTPATMTPSFGVRAAPANRMCPCSSGSGAQVVVHATLPSDVTWRIDACGCARSTALLAMKSPLPASGATAKPPEITGGRSKGRSSYPIVPRLPFHPHDRHHRHMTKRMRGDACTPGASERSPRRSRDCAINDAAAGHRCHGSGRAGRLGRLSGRRSVGGLAGLGRLGLEALEAAVQRAAIDAEHAGGVGLVAADRGHD